MFKTGLHIVMKWCSWNWRAMAAGCFNQKFINLASLYGPNLGLTLRIRNVILQWVWLVSRLYRLHFIAKSIHFMPIKGLRSLKPSFLPLSAPFCLSQSIGTQMTILSRSDDFTIISLLYLAWRSQLFPHPACIIQLRDKSTFHSPFPQRSFYETIYHFPSRP